VKRREFLQVSAAVGGGLLIGVTVTPLVGTTAAAATDVALNVYLSIAPDGRVTITAPVPEIGQGVRTALPMLVAEELGVVWQRVRVVQAPGSQDYEGRNQRAAGSNSVSVYWAPMRRAGATARDLLVRAAGKTWGVDAGECRAANGRVRHAASGRELGYGALAAGAARLAPNPDVPLKNAGQFRLLGTRVPNVDAADVARGNVTFGTDVRLPGMVFASIERCPVYGGRVVRFDDSQAKSVRGFRRTVKFDAVGDPERPYIREGVAVIADNTWAAFAARKHLDITWDDSANRRESTAGLHEQCQRLLEQPGAVVRNSGDVDAAMANAAHTHTATYHLPFIVHTPMETMNCTADVRDDCVTLHVPTQMPAITQSALASRLSLPEAAIRVYPTRVGGGFGRRLSIDFVLEAVQLSRALGRPVQVSWTREDEIAQGWFRPFSYHRLRGALDVEQRVIAWEHRQCGTSRYAFRDGEDPAGSEFNPGDVPAECVGNYRLEYRLAESNLPRTILRAPGHNALAFVVQSFIDELAHLAGADPLEFRLRLLAAARRKRYEYAREDSEIEYIEPGRLQGVLLLAAKAASWGTPLPEGRGRGIACHYTFGSYVAHVVEVRAEPGSDRISVDRVVSAVDCGQVANLAGLEAQVEGGVIDGLGAALYGEISVDGGRVLQENFDTYRLLRFNEAPTIDVHVVESDHPPTGMGEPPYPPVAPALCNAVFAANGTRHRRLPLMGLPGRRPL
jgi:isoquinoline 1-oxidoreductase subunit beta